MATEVVAGTLGLGANVSFSIGDRATEQEAGTPAPDLERIWARRLEEFAAPGVFDGRCHCCGGPAVLHVRGHSVYVRAPGVEPPAEHVHPASVNGWRDGATE